MSNKIYFDKKPGIKNDYEAYTPIKIDSKRSFTSDSIYIYLDNVLTWRSNTDINKSSSVLDGLDKLSLFSIRINVDPDIARYKSEEIVLVQEDVLTY